MKHLLERAGGPEQADKQFGGHDRRLGGQWSDAGHERMARECTAGIVQEPRGTRHDVGVDQLLSIGAVGPFVNEVPDPVMSEGDPVPVARRCR